MEIKILQFKMQGAQSKWNSPCLASAKPHTSEMRRLILLIHDFSLVIQLLEANYTLNILVFLYWWQIILGTFPFSSLAARLLTHSICSLNIPYTMLLIIFEERLLHIGNHFSLRKWRRRPHPPHFPTKLAVVASFSYKIGSGGKDLATLLAAVLTWSG